MSGGDGPVIKSRLDTDFYKFTMSQMIRHNHPAVPTVFSFRNRTRSVRLADYVDIGELRENLDHAGGLGFADSEPQYLRDVLQYGERMFKDDYIEYLKGFRLSDYTLGVRDGQFELEFHGTWPEASMWETFAMSIVNELYIKGLMKGYSSAERQLVWEEGRRRLAEKTAVLASHPEIIYTDFTTRRRASRIWHDEIVRLLSKQFPPQQFRGTSNVYLAKKYGLMPMGTNAHELPMVYSGVYYGEDERTPLVSQARVLEDWEREYGLALSIFLPDTLGSDFFFERIVTPRQLREWKGSRHDSGDPFEYGEKRICDYRQHGIDPASKLIVFADGLDVETMMQLFGRFDGRINMTYGWGTNLGNDIGFKPVSIIVKPTWAAGHDVAKLSDNIEKATGSPAAIARMMRLVGYDVQYAKECRY